MGEKALLQVLDEWSKKKVFLWLQRCQHFCCELPTIIDARKK